MDTRFTLIDLDPFSESSCALLAASDAYLAALYPPESNHLSSPDDLAKPNVRFLGIQADSRIVGCGAVKLMGPSNQRYGEIKRVFVLPEFRGHGLSKKLMMALESHLVDQGIRISRLETGIHQPEALGLYRRLGYIERDVYGDYQPDPLSVFMEKDLDLR